MRCPRCKTDVPDGHSYCTNCRTILYDYSPDYAEPTETALGRAGKRLFDLLILLALIAGGIALGRAIQWKQILSGFQPAAAVSPSPRQNKQNTGRQSSKTPQEKSADSSKPVSDENKNDKTEQSAPADNTRPTAKPEPVKKKDGQ
jgi:cytoskeletal protein RodZ